MPRQRDLFVRLGNRVPVSNSADQQAIFSMSKNDQLDVVTNIGKRMQQEEYDEYAAQQAEIDALREQAAKAQVETT